jgi:hypothetical protein
MGLGAKGEIGESGQGSRTVVSHYLYNFSFANVAAQEILPNLNQYSPCPHQPHTQRHTQEIRLFRLE